MWWVALAAITAWILWATASIGRRFALGSAVALSLVVPNWVEISIGSLPFDMRVSSAAVALIIYCLHPRTRWHGPLVLADFSMIALLAVHVASDTVNEGFHWSTLVRAYGEWALAYVAGRLAIQELSDVGRLLPVVCIVAMVLGGWAVVEALVHENPADAVVGQRPPEMFPRSAIRLGLKRAEGPVRHPIFFALLQLLLFPWTLEAARQAVVGRRARTWLASPWISGFGIVATVSRGPVLALVLVFYLLLLAYRPAWRMALLGCGLACVVLVIAARQQIISGLHAISGDANLPVEARVVIDGKEVPYTGTMHRILLWRVYAKAMERAGWMGFGTDSTTGFPVRVPFGPEDKQTLEYLQFVDNEYILLDLRFGRLGVLCFACLLAAPAAYLMLLGRTGADYRMFCLGLGAVLIAMLLELLTVWLPHDFGFPLLWSAGMGAGLWSDARRKTAATARPLQNVLRAEKVNN